MERFRGDFVGIDIGMVTTYIGYKDAIADMGICCVMQEGSHMIPSVISFEDEKTTLIGMAAKENQVLNPKKTVDNFKRNMGNDDGMSDCIPARDWCGSVDGSRRTRDCGCNK